MYDSSINSSGSCLGQLGKAVAESARLGNSLRCAPAYFGLGEVTEAAIGMERFVAGIAQHDAANSFYAIAGTSLGQMKVGIAR